MRKFSKKTVALVVSIALLLCVGIGTTLAYLMDYTDPVVNEFTPSQVSTSVDESFADGVKSDVSIQNTGDIDANIRAAIVVTWQDANGNVYGQKPVAGTDYNIDITTSMQNKPAGQWTQNGDFYYWSAPVAPGANTGVLITSCTAVDGKAPAGYALCVEIIGSGIQVGGITGAHPWGI